MGALGKLTAVRWPPDLLVEMQELADARGMKLGTFIRAVMRLYVDVHRGVSDGKGSVGLARAFREPRARSKKQPAENLAIGPQIPLRFRGSKETDSDEE